MAALNWAASHNMHIASMSLGGTASSTTLANAVKNAYDRGVLVVAAAGNNGANSIPYPAAFAQAVAVGATDGSDRKASFSNYGSKLELVAPGVSIRSTVGSSSYAVYSGTSMATPHVSGVAALVWSSGAATTNAGVRAVLQNTAQDLGTAGRDSTYGYGLVRADRAAGIAPAPTPTPDTIASSIVITSPAANADIPIGTVIVKGTAADNSGGSGVKSVELRLNDNAYAIVTPKAAGDWSIKINVPAGSHRLVSKAIDNAGNQASHSIMITAR